jgi:uncharacterized membrane protein
VAHGFLQKQQTKKEKMKTFKADLPIYFIILAPFLFVAWNWAKFPEEVPIHFGLDGQPDDFASKWIGLVAIPASNIGLYFLILLLPKLDPKGRNYALFEGKWRSFRLIIHSLFSFFTLVTALYSLGYEIEIGKWVPVGLAFLFLFLGNLLGTVRPNYFVGIKTPWTLHDETVWVSTHRMAARLWVYLSVLAIPMLLIFPSNPYIFGTYMALLLIPPVVYSYLAFKKIRKERKS